MDKVKCVDCGRTLPGPEKRCDVCGGRMTYDAANSYFTPEGPVSKIVYEKHSYSTPDRQSTKQVSANKSKLEKESKSYGKTTVLGKAKKVVTNSPFFGKDSKGDRIFENIGKGVGAIILVVILASFFIGDAPFEYDTTTYDVSEYHYYDFEDGSDDYIIEGDGYELSLVYASWDQGTGQLTIDMNLDVSSKIVMEDVYDMFRYDVSGVDLRVGSIDIKDEETENWSWMTEDDRVDYIFKKDRRYNLTLDNENISTMDGMTLNVTIPDKTDKNSDEATVTQSITLPPSSDWYSR